MGSYIPLSKAEKEEMQKVIGIQSVDEIFTMIPHSMKVDKLNIPKGKSEMEVISFMDKLSAKNKIFGSIFRGMGAYHHYIPSIVKAVISKEEFITAYTPYQAEISQGLLQGIFEFQTMICELTGMDVSNASVYDGATAAAEAVAMCIDRKRKKVLVSETVKPMTLETIKTYSYGSGAQVIVIPEADGKADIHALCSMASDEIACLYVEQTNVYGLIEDMQVLGENIHSMGGKFIAGIYPIAAGILKTPKEFGADIAVGEGQSLGLPLSFGGPYLGFMSCTEAMLRKLPGRIVGETVDAEGNRAFVLTMQAREQHIRREKASSNICSNQAYCALTASVYLASMGTGGLKQVAEHCVSKAHYLAEEICSIDGFKLSFSGEYFNEFATTCPIAPNILLKELEEKDILGGYPYKDKIIWCVTETNTKEQIDNLVLAIKEACNKWS